MTMPRKWTQLNSQIEPDIDRMGRNPSNLRKSMIYYLRSTWTSTFPRCPPAPPSPASPSSRPGCISSVCRECVKASNGCSRPPRPHRSTNIWMHFLGLRCQHPHLHANACPRPPCPHHTHTQTHCAFGDASKLHGVKAQLGPSKHFVNHRQPWL